MTVSLLLLAAVVIWFILKTSAPKVGSSYVFYLADENFCSDIHSWQQLRSIFPAGVYEDARKHIDELAYNKSIVEILNRGLYCAKCHYVSGTESVGINPSELVSIVTAMLDSLHKEKQQLSAEESVNENENPEL